MRFFHAQTIILSEDNLTDPQKIRFKESDSMTDIVEILESKTLQETLPVGTHLISMSSITEGKFLYFKAENDATIEIDGEELDTIGGKPVSIWSSFTSLSVIISGVPCEVTCLIAGE